MTTAETSPDRNTGIPDERVREAIALLQDAITECARSGAPEPFDVEQFKLRMRKRYEVG